jgi:membrane protease YdiL (CAAX protease family)
VGLVGVVSALAWAGNLASGTPPRDAVYKYSTAISELVLFALIFVIVLWIARGMPPRDAFALRRPRHAWQAVGLAFIALVAIAVTAASLEPVIHAGREQGLTPVRWEPSHAGAFAANLVALALVGPVVEELTFRGLGFTLLRQFGEWTAVFAVGVAFALWHGLVAGLPVLFVFGAALAFVRSRTGSIYPCIAVHALFNTVALLGAVTR